LGCCLSDEKTLSSEREQKSKGKTKPCGKSGRLGSITQGKGFKKKDLLYHEKEGSTQRSRARLEQINAKGVASPRKRMSFVKRGLYISKEVLAKKKDTGERVKPD